jgi:hypothetical protein
MPPSPLHFYTEYMGRVSPPLRWQAGKVWQGTGSAVRLPPLLWWILASRPSAPWLLTGIPDAIGPLSSHSALPGPSALPFQARAPSSTSARMTKRVQCLHAGGVLLSYQPHTIQYGWPLCKAQQERYLTSLFNTHTHNHTHKRDPALPPFFPPIGTIPWN